MNQDCPCTESFLMLTKGTRKFIILFSVLLCMFETVHKNFNRFKTTHLTRIYQSPLMTDCLTALPFLSLRLYGPTYDHLTCDATCGSSTHLWPNDNECDQITTMTNGMWVMWCEWYDVHLDGSEVFEVTVHFHQFSCSFPLPQ